MIVNALRTSEMCKWLGWRGLLTGNIVQSDTLRNVAFYGAVFKMLEQSVSAIKLLKGDFAYKNSKEYIEYCVLASREYWFLMFDNLLCLFDPRTMSVVRQVKISSATGTMFAAYSYKEDFILYGEVEIYRVAPDLSIKWSFSGKDIFVRYHNNEPEPAFKMKKDRICLYDFGDNYYEINYDGILLDSKFVLKE